MSARMVMGPVLSFRGLKGAELTRPVWQVSALVVVPVGTPPPAMERDAQSVSPPLLLASTPAGDAYRYDLSVSLGPTERRVPFGVQGEPADALWPAGQRWTFTVPARGQLPRLAYGSCNGFSDPKLIKAMKAPANGVWQDLLRNHDKRLRPVGYVLDREQQWHEPVCHDRGLQRFHVLLAGGDQVYTDAMWSELPELKAWTELAWDEQLRFKPSATLVNKIKAYCWRLYTTRWALDVPTQQQPDKHLNAGLAFACLPSVMMWDDHDILDGWGSYSPRMQKSPLLQTLFAAAREAFWVCQLQMPLSALPPLQDRNPAGAKDPRWAPVNWAAVRQADALSPRFLEGQAGFSHHLDLGELQLSVMDLRTDRSQQQILSEDAWSAWQGVWQGLRPGGHVLVVSSVPVAHPKLSLMEKPLTWFASDSVTDSNADDLNDHWSHDRHENERKRLVRTLVSLGERARCRVTLVSGDVHVAAWGVIARNVQVSNGQKLTQLTSSALVHPSLSGFVQGLFLKVLNAAANEAQVIDSEHTLNMMNFPSTSAPMMAARNWLALELDETARPEFGARRLWASWRCEQPDGFSNHLLALHPYKRAEPVAMPTVVKDHGVDGVGA